MSPVSVRRLVLALLSAVLVAACTVGSSASPSTGAKTPLVVLAHGGPVGVADTLHFDPEVQFLASLGYAVLQVNFRGSDGYGKAHRDKGWAGFGTLIEEDIHAALDVVTGGNDNPIFFRTH